MRLAKLLIVILLMGLAACDPANLMSKMTPAADEQAARNYLDQLRRGNFEQIEKDTDPKLKVGDIVGTLKRLSATFPAQQPISVKVVGSNTGFNPDDYTSNITFEYEYVGAWLLANVAVQKKSGVTTIIGLNVYPIPISIEESNSFKLKGKSTAHYAILAAAVIFSLFSLYALVVCIRTKMVKRKWLWIIFIIFGFGKLTLNWTTGQWTFFPLAIQLFSASAMAPLYSPWSIAVSLPLGAIVFLIRRKKLSSVSDPLGQL